MNPARFASHHRVVHVLFTPLRNYAPRGARLRARHREEEEQEEGQEEEEEDKPHTWSHYPPLPPIFCENTTVYVRTGPSTWAFIATIAESKRAK